MGHRIGAPETRVFHGPNIKLMLTLHQDNGLYYCNSLGWNINKLKRDEMEWVNMAMLA